MTIYDIKDRVTNAPYFFTHDTMKFFHQTMASFHVKKQPDGTYYIWAPMYDHRGHLVGKTERIFNPIDNTLNFIQK